MVEVLPRLNHIRDQKVIKTENSSGSTNQMTFIVASKTVNLSPRTFVLTQEVLSRQKFCKLFSMQNVMDSEIFKAMFPDSEIAKNYRQGETKVRYNIQFGIAPYIKDLLLKGFSDCPFSLKFDETATHKVLKQYNAYVQYWSKNYDCIVNSYCGSLLVTVPMKTLQNILNILMRTGNGIPHTYCNQELAFQRKLLKSLEEKSQTTFFDIGTCPLHIVHNAFEHGLKFLNFNAEQFIVDINSFFKLSSARREDFRALEEIAELPAHFTIKHSSTRWVNLKKMNNGKI